MEKFCRKGHLKRSGKRSLAILLCACMIGMMIPISAKAENGSTDTGLCEHHTEHTTECGYVAPARGHECEHVHDKSCGYQEASECNHVHTEECGENGENCTHVHTSECGYAEGHACEHVHDEECGYAEASEGSPCTYVCDICGEEGKQGENIVSDENLTKQATDKHITTWQWIDEEEYLDEETGNLALPGANAQTPAYFDDVISFLPTQIQATIEDEEDTEAEAANKTITLGEWSCDNYPEEGAYQGYYTFAATLPEGYELSEEAEALEVLVELGGAQMYENSITATKPSVGDGSENNPYQISSAAELYWFAALVNGETSVDGVTAADKTACAELKNSIIVNSGVLKSDGSLAEEASGFTTWTPISTDDGNPYTGTFDGKGYTISGLYFNDTSKYLIGLFGFVGSGSKIRNVGIVDSYFNGSSGVGGVCGYCTSGEITNCYNTGTVIGTGSNIGGVCGYSSGTITDCYNTGNVSGTSTSDQEGRVGGVCGCNNGYPNMSTITRSYNSGKVSGGYVVGGVCGANGFGYPAQTINCYNTGEVTGTGDDVGGICGFNDAYIESCYNSAAVSGGSYVGSVCGFNHAVITICYYLTTESELSGVGGSGTNAVNNAYGKTADQFNSGEVTYLLNGEKSEGTAENPLAWYQNIDLDGVTGDAYPLLDSNGHGTVYYGYDDDACENPKYSNSRLNAEPIHAYTNGFCTRCGAYEPATLTTDKYDIDGDEVKDNVYEIGNAGQLYWFADKVNNENVTYGSANAVLTEDIIVNTGVLDENGDPSTGDFKSWTPIGGFYNSNFVDYSGIFDGNNRTISGLYYNETIASSEEYFCVYVGLFGSNDGTIKNVVVEDSYFGLDFSGTVCWVGGVIAVNFGAIENCYNKATVTVTGTSSQGSYAGGVCGINTFDSETNLSGKIINCNNAGKVTATGVSGNCYVGGVSGANTNYGTIESCSNTGKVSGTENVGGVCGQNYVKYNTSYKQTIKDSYNAGEVSGTSRVGGVCGCNIAVGGGKVEITNCYNIGEVTGTGDGVGGVCGLNSQESGASATVTNCYYLAGCNTEDTNFTCQEGISKTTKEFASGSVCYLLNGSLSENPVWYQNIDRDGETADAYPVFDSNHGTVYRTTPCPIEYSNTLSKTVAHIFHVDENDSTKHTCEKCGYSEAHSTTNFSYSADEETNRITVYCNEGGCDANIGYVELTAPSGTITYNGTEKEAKVSDTVIGVNFSSTPITYKQGETTLSSAPVDAGTYTASITLGDATVSVEFTIEQATPTISWGMSWGTSWVEITEIPVTYTGSEIAPDKLVSPTVTLVNGETYSGEISYSYRVQGSSDAFTSGLPTEIGIYEVKASIAADGNYKEAASTVTLTVDWFNTINVATLTDQSGISLSGNDWWAKSVTFTAPNGFNISNNLPVSDGTSFVYNEQTGADGITVTYYLKNSAGEIAKKTATVRIDKTAPDWNGENDGISIKTNKWKSLLSTISFGLFYKETVDVKVCASDSLSGVVAYYYYVDSTGGTVKTAAELDALNFTEYTEGVSGQNPSVIVTSLDPNGNYIVYAYAVDATGNRSAYVCSEGVVVDSTAPAISNIVAPSQGTPELTDTTAQISFTGSEAGTYFYIVKEISETAPTTITDFATEQPSDGYSTWTANPNVAFAQMTADVDNKISLNGLKANTEYTLYLAAVDLAGNSTETTVYSQSFTTCRTIPTVADADMPKISGTYGQTVADMTLTPGTAKVGNDTITGIWAVTDSSKTDVPTVGTIATYQVTFTPAASYNDMYDTVNVQVTPTVAQKVVTVTAENKTKTYGENNPDLTFTVPEGALVGTDTEDDLGVTLSCEATVASSVKEGGYAITGTSSSANYNVTIIQGTLTITRADAQIIVGTASYDKTFGEADFNLNVIDTNTEANVQYDVTAGDDVVSVSNGTVTILKAGNATITVSLPESTNYKAADSKTITVTVAKKSGHTVDAVNRSYFYVKDSADTIDLSTMLPADCGNVTYGTPQVSGELYTSNGQPTISSDGKLSYTVKQAENYGATGTIQVTVTTDNYDDFTITVNISLKDQLPVKLQEGSSVTLQNSALTYGQALSTLTFDSAVFVDDEDNVVAGTLAWKTPDEKPNAGTTSATWVFTPNDEAYAELEGNVSITVNKATPNVTALPTVAERTYNPIVSLTDSDLAYGTVNVAGNWSWQSAGIIPTVNNSGYVAVFTPTDSTNYETVTRTITVTVSKATPDIETAPTAAAITYGDILGASALTGGTVQYSSSDETAISGSFAWGDNSVKPSVSDSDTTTYQVIFTPSDTDNYNTVETTVTLTVNKAENTPNMPSSTINVANSCKKVSDVTLPTDWIWQDTDKDTALTVGTAVTATAVYNGADKGNYENETVSVTITRSACDHAHTELRNAKEATCTEPGYTGDTYCTDCGVKIKTGTATPALGHNYTSKVTTEPTTDREGVRTYTCDRCGHSYTESIPKLPEEEHQHSYSDSVTKEPTCTDTGVRTYTCSCGDSYTETIPALGHNYTSKVTKEPTTSSEGVMTYTCERCGHSYTRAIEKLQDNDNNNQGDNQQPEDNKPDTGKPYIKDEHGKEGWDVIKDEVDKAKDGDTVVVEMNGSSVVPGDVLDEIKGKDVTIVFDMGDGITWSVNGKSITVDRIGDIDFSVKTGTNTIPIDIINNVTGESYSLQISLAYDGEFGFTAVLSINMDASNAGLYANLFYYNEKSGELEFICADEIAADGTAELIFTHASDYVIAIDTEPMNVASNETSDTNVDVAGTSSEGQNTETESTQTSAEVSNDAWNPWWIIVIGIMVIVIGAGVFFVVKKREEKEKE